MNPRAALKELQQYPAGYDAHKDGLAEKWDHAESVNKLLAAARALAEAPKLEREKAARQIREFASAINAMCVKSSPVLEVVMAMRKYADQMTRAK